MNSCPFCELEASRIFVASDCAAAIKDDFPVTPGHVLVIPRRHVDSIYDLTDRAEITSYDTILVAKRR